MSLHGFRGRAAVVLSFYPRDFTPGCTTQLCLYRDHNDEIHDLGAVVIGVSPDDEQSHDRFAATHRMPFHLVSDRDLAISRKYGVVRLGGILRLLRRVTFVIDTFGRVRRVTHHEFAIHRHLDDVLATLHKIRSERGSVRSPEGY
jgi:thioredoxin-dependent peroxiredoxin